MPNRAEVIEVTYSGRGLPIPLLCFQVPEGKSYWRMYDVNGSPENEDAAMEMLEAAWEKMHHNFWYQHESTLLLHPPPPNDGEKLTIVVEYEQDRGR